MDEPNGYRIAIVDPVGRKAGMDRYDLSLGRCLRRAGHSVSVFSNFTLSGDGVVSFALFRTPGGRLLSFVATLSGLYRSLRRCRRSSFDYVVLHFFKGGLADVFAALFCRLAGLRTILVVHEVTPVDGPRWRPFRRATLHLHRGVRLVHNVFTRQELIRLLGDPAAPSTFIVPHVAYECPDASPLPPSLQPWSARPFLLFFGQWKRSKGLDTLLAALSLPGGRSWHLVLAGRPRDLPDGHVRRQIRILGLSDRVTIHARAMDDAERDFLFRHADAVVVPYLRGYQSGVMITAMSCGRVVIASDIEPHRELIRDGESGYLFKAGDPESLAGVIGRLPGPGVSRARIEAAARETMRLGHGCETVNRLFGNLLKT